jgi:hypothetical protein
MTTLPTFTLNDLQGQSCTFPTTRPTLLCFVREDCQTCNLTLPLIEAMHRAYGDAVNIWCVGQESNDVLIERHHLTLPILDDTALHVSYRYAIETVPTLILADAQGHELRRLIGYRKDEWQSLVASIQYSVVSIPINSRDTVMVSEAKPSPSDSTEIASQKTLAMTPARNISIDWNTLPDWRPGCGSKSVEPGIVERLQAEAEDSPLRARRIEIASADDEFEFMFAQGLTDGLPVVPPTPERVLRMLQGTTRHPQDVVAIVPPNLAPATVEKVAINAVMAGCKPEYLPVVIAALEAVCTDEFNIHGVNATTWGATPVIVVNGPIRQRIGMNAGLNALGHGNRANATIGRALKLTLANVGGAKPGGVERSALGTPAKFGLCFAENEEVSVWEPLHVERGFKKEENVVTVFALEGPRGIADQLSRTARALATSFGLALESCWHPKLHNYGDVMLVICPEHVETLKRDGWTKANIRNRIQEATARPLRELLRDDDCGEGIPPQRFGVQHANQLTNEQLNQRIPKFASPNNIHLVVAGGDAGKFSAIFGGWVSGPTGAQVVSKRVEG